MAIQAHHPQIGPRFGVEASVSVVTDAEGNQRTVHDTIERKAKSGNTYRVPLYQPVVYGPHGQISERRLSYGEAFEAAARMAQGVARRIEDEIDNRRNQAIIEKLAATFG